MPETNATTQLNGSGALDAAPLADSPPAPDPRIGLLLKDTYKLERRLGEGGMGSVYLAEHALIRKKVAIKILAAEYAHRPELKERFLREARAAAAIEDDHVIEIHDFGETPDGAAFFVMEYLHGEDLAALIRREAPLPWPRARDLALQICSALAAAHARGIVHRDMKPGNCFRLDRPGVDLIKVLDFGIAKIQGPDEGVGQALTRTGMIFGTPEYMSPEQARGERHDHRVDIYAVGVILFELLTGQTPFQSDTFMGLLNKHMFDAPPRPADLAPDARIPAAAEAVVLKALQKDPGLRFQSMDELAAALRGVDAGVAPEVVPEAVRAPLAPGAAIGFRSAGPGLADTLPPGPSVRPLAEPPPRRLGLALAAAIGGAALAAVAIALFLQQADDDKGTGPSEHVPVASPDLIAPPANASAPEPAPPPATSPDLLPLAPPTISVRIDTGGVAAQVVDEGGAILGSTTDPGGIHLPRGASERVLRLRADGRVETPVKLVPSEDRALTVDLPPVPAPTRGGKPPKSSTKAGKSDTRVDAPVDPPAEPKVEPKPGPTSPDLISPFKKK